MRRVVLSFLAAAVLAGASPGAAVMKALPTEELTKSSDVVVEGDVQEVTSSWTADGKAIISSATVRVDEVVRGVQVSGTLTVDYEGGEVDGVGMGVSDMASVAAGQRVLVFLKKTAASRSASRYEIIGRAQGLYKIGVDGIARKGGFSLLPGSGGAVDNDLDVNLLKEKIRGVR